jgi:hypothetical protein
MITRKCDSGKTFRQKHRTPQNWRAWSVRKFKGASDLWLMGLPSGFTLQLGIFRISKLLKVSVLQ